MLRRSLLMWLILFSMPILIAMGTRSAHADCTASESYLNEETAPCPFLSKTAHWRVYWGDGHSANLDPTGSGRCNTKSGCCGASPSSVECWPLFNQPTISGTMVSIVVTNRTAPISFTVCGTSECDQVNVTCTSEGSTTFSVNHSCASGGGGGGGGESGCDTDFDCYLLGCSECNCVFGQCSDNTPILIDVYGNGLDLTDAAHGVNFDLNGDQIAGRVAWTSTASDDAWLVLDRNGNGQVDGGVELFGNHTPQPASTSPNGFIALAEFDKPANGGNGDGRLGQADAVFNSLRLWQDANRNGVSEPSELKTLASVGLSAIDLDYKEAGRLDRAGNQFRYRAKITDTQGKQLGRWAWDVILVSRL